MPSKLLAPSLTPSLVQERLRQWGEVIRIQRMGQKIRASDLCARLGISDATLRRLQKGDPGASAALYLSALMVLGVLDQCVPMADPVLWRAHLPQPQRVRLAKKSTLDEYF